MLNIMCISINFFSSSIAQMLAEDSSTNDSFLVSGCPFAELSRMLDSESEGGSPFYKVAFYQKRPRHKILKVKLGQMRITSIIFMRFRMFQ